MDPLEQIAYITSGLFTGWTVNAVIMQADLFIGGCGSSYTKAQLNAVLTAINENYVDGTMDNGFLSCTPVDMPTTTSASTGSGQGRKKDLLNDVIENVFTASPNPASDQLNVQLVHGEAGVVSIDLLDLAGRNVQHVATYTAERGDERRQVLFVGELPSGVYLLTMTQNGSRSIQRIVVGH